MVECSLFCDFKFTVDQKCNLYQTANMERFESWKHRNARRTECFGKRSKLFPTKMRRTRRQQPSRRRSTAPMLPCGCKLLCQHPTRSRQARPGPARRFVKPTCGPPREVWSPRFGPVGRTRAHSRQECSTVGPVSRDSLKAAAPRQAGLRVATGPGAWIRALGPCGHIHAPRRRSFALECAAVGHTASRSVSSAGPRAQAHRSQRGVAGASMAVPQCAARRRGEPGEAMHRGQQPAGCLPETGGSLKPVPAQALSPPALSPLALPRGLSARRQAQPKGAGMKRPGALFSRQTCAGIGPTTPWCLYGTVTAYETLLINRSIIFYANFQ